MPVIDLREELKREMRRHPRVVYQKLFDDQEVRDRLAVTMPAFVPFKAYNGVPVPAIHTQAFIPEFSTAWQKIKPALPSGGLRHIDSELDTRQVRSRSPAVRSPYEHADDGRGREGPCRSHGLRR